MSLPLHENWNLLYDYVRTKATTETWSEHLKPICTISSCNTLLYTLQNAFDADELPAGSNIHFFREYIQPAWEDANNIGGGKWVLELSKTDNGSLTELWNKTVALCASETVENETITGCVLSPRKFVDRIAIWTRGKDEEMISVGKTWKRTIDINENINFLVHELSLQGVRDKATAKYTI
ncbi:translation initiation factor eIF4E [Gurleya vavrai]